MVLVPLGFVLVGSSPPGDAVRPVRGCTRCRARSLWAWRRFRRRNRAARPPGTGTRIGKGMADARHVGLPRGARRRRLRARGAPPLEVDAALPENAPDHAVVLPPRALRWRPRWSRHRPRRSRSHAATWPCRSVTPGGWTRLGRLACGRRGLRTLRPAFDAHPDGVRRRQSAGPLDVHRRGAGRRRGPAGRAVRRPRGPVADLDAAGARAAARGRLHRQRAEVPAAGQSRSEARGSAAAAAATSSGRSNWSIPG